LFNDTEDARGDAEIGDDEAVTVIPVTPAESARAAEADWLANESEGLTTVPEAEVVPLAIARTVPVGTMPVEAPDATEVDEAAAEEVDASLTTIGTSGRKTS
jgi:hypothetical protein